MSSGSHDKNSRIDWPLDLTFDRPLAYPDPPPPLTDQGPRSSASPATPSSPATDGYSYTTPPPPSSPATDGYSYTTPPPPRPTPSPHVLPYPIRYGAPEVLFDFARGLTDRLVSRPPLDCFTPPSPWFYVWTESNGSNANVNIQSQTSCSLDLVCSTTPGGEAAPIFSCQHSAGPAALDFRLLGV